MIRIFSKLESVSTAGDIQCETRIASNIIKHGSTQQLIGHIIAIIKKLEEQNPIKIYKDEFE